MPGDQQIVLKLSLRQVRNKSIWLRIDQVWHVPGEISAPRHGLEFLSAWTKTIEIVSSESR